MIANSPDPEQDATNDIWVFLKPMAEGDMLHANMPYVYKPKKAVTDYEFTTTAHTILKAKADDARITMMTAENTYTIYGTYAPTTATAPSAGLCAWRISSAAARRQPTPAESSSTTARARRQELTKLEKLMELAAIVGTRSTGASCRASPHAQACIYIKV